ncbi:hypothetical protein TRICI_004538 [Trichomonascus ciferrii]|uniref:very-long-chain enoyl-CoA reductase n=1 Tax=Trichomonascus ciferrii TaxID=44093 RepID=A0A642V0R9_9ASCO|nr:hypothetical protein TRICI_004538 [Trichomonascus ciferrii]
MSSDRIQFKSRGKKGIKNLPKELTTPLDTRVSVVQEKLAQQTGLSVNRIRLTVPPEDAGKPGPDGKKKRDIGLKADGYLKDYITAESQTIYVKDLGPQIAWRTVFLIEYFGPLVIHPVFYFFQQQIYGAHFEHSRDQQLIFVFSMLHFLKREYETAFVHKFSLATMPMFNIFKNSSHYWLLSGVLLAYFNYAPPSYFTPDAPLWKRILFSRQQLLPMGETALYGMTLFWLFSELSNFWTHITLSNLRPPGTTVRKIPFGYGFNWVSCPNYFFETLAWTAVALISQNWSATLFVTVATAQMYIWALKKHRRYKKEFPDYPKNRRVYVPYLL